MNRVAIRKIVLLALIAVLACVYLAQLALGNRSTVRVVPLAEEPDAITIVAGADASSALWLAKEDGAWTLAGGASRYAADAATVDAMVRALQEIKLLGTVTGNPGGDASRYGLDEASRITVTASRGGTVVRTVMVGKNTSTGNQCYVQLDGKGAVYLENGTLRGAFAVAADDVRDKSVYSVDAADITRVSVTLADGAYAVARRVDVQAAGAASADAGGGADVAAAAPQPVWALAEGGGGAALDDAKAAAWVRSLAALSASAWAEDDAPLPAAEPDAVADVTAAGATYTVRLYALPDDADGRFLCASSATPYPFYLSKYVAQKYSKPLAELLAQGEEE